MLFLIGFIVFIYLIYSFYVKNKSFSKNDPKRPFPALPFIGNLHLFGTKNPHEALHQLSEKYGDVYGFFMGDVYTIVIQDLEIYRELFVKNFDNFIDRYHIPTLSYVSNKYKGLVVADEYYWRENKKLVVNAFSNNKIRKQGVVIANQVLQLNNLFKEFADNGTPFNPRKYCQKYSLNVMLKYVFSLEVPYDDSSNGRVDRFIKPMEDLLKLASSANLFDYVHIFAPLYEKYLFATKNYVEKIEEFLKEVYDEHLSTFNPNQPRDIIDGLILELDTTNPETFKRIMNVTYELMIAGTDTSSTSIQWYLILMVNYPNVQEKIFNEILQVYNNKKNNNDSIKDIVITLEDRASTPYLNAVIKETLRYKVVGPLSLPKIAKEDLMVQNYFIPKGTQLVFNSYGTSRNPKYWVAPNEFLPERYLSDEQSNSYRVFGIGPRDCIGMYLAQDEIFLAVANILLHYKVSSVDGKKIDESEVFGITTHPNPFEIVLSNRQI